jgi:ABC-type polysaccharide/polyol phosphate export permease
MTTSHRFLIYLAWKDFISSYYGSFLGSLWGLIEPIFYISLTFFFFQYAMGGAQMAGHPYSNYVLPAMLAWLVANTGVQAAIGAVPQFRHFLHLEFDLRTVALIKLLPTFAIHVLMLFFLSAYFYLNGVSTEFSPLLLIYGILCLAVVLTGLFWILMSISPFAKDVKNIVGVVLQVGFWVSPIFWSGNHFDGIVGGLVKLNPFYYPLEIYRAAFTGEYGVVFSAAAVVFWTMCAFFLYFGNRTYTRARPQFGDVL